MDSRLNLRADFPLLAGKNGKNLVYLDSAATAQKPQVVLEAINSYYTTSNANVHRGVHALSEASTQAWEESRATVARFFGADVEELIIVRNTTEAINGVVYAWGERMITQGDVIVTSILEHHSNFVPWQMLAQKKNAVLEVVGVTPEGQIDTASLEAALKTHGKSVRLVALSHVSNVLGSKLDVEEVARLLKTYAPDARLLLDSAQAAPHLPINFHDLGADFLAFSGHKLYGPMGSGGLLVKKSLLTSGEFAPWLFGGGMIGEVRIQKTTFSDDLTDRFTAGTPDVASAVGLAKAIEYLQSLGWEAIQAHEHTLVEYALQRLQTMPEVTVVGPLSTNQRVGSIAFVYTGVHAHDVAQVLDSQGIAVRSGHHCAMPLHEQFAWGATVRASFGVYNSTEDIDRLVDGLKKVQAVFGT